MTTHNDDDEPQGEVPAIDLSAWLSGDVQPDRATLEDRSVPRFPGGGYPVPAAVRHLLEDPPVAGVDEPDTGAYPFQEHFPPPAGHAYTLADVAAWRRSNDSLRRLDVARRNQPVYPGPTAYEALYVARQSLTGVPPHRPDRHAQAVLMPFPSVEPFDPDLVRALDCNIIRPHSRAFERSRGQQVLLALSLLALVAIAAWIIIGAGR